MCINATVTSQYILFKLILFAIYLQDNQENEEKGIVLMAASFLFFSMYPEDFPTKFQSFFLTNNLFSKKLCLSIRQPQLFH